VLSAVLPGVDLRTAQQMVTQRALTHYATVTQALDAAKLRADQVDVARLSVASRYFTVRGQLRLGKTVIQELSLVGRAGHHGDRAVAHAGGLVAAGAGHLRVSTMTATVCPCPP